VASKYKKPVNDFTGCATYEGDRGFLVSAYQPPPPPHPQLPLLFSALTSERVIFFMSISFGVVR